MLGEAHLPHGSSKTLKAFSAIPPKDRVPAVRESIGKGVEYLLKHHIYKRKPRPFRISKPGWQRFTFPLMYQTDVLEILLILADLGVRDKRMDEALGLVASKQKESGPVDGGF